MLRRKHGRARLRRRILANGDIAAEDPTRRHGWALSIATRSEKAGWGPRTALYYHGAFYRFRMAQAPSEENPDWLYCFDPWPDNEVLRRVVDYEAEVALETGPLLDRVRRWIARLLLLGSRPE